MELISLSLSHRVVVAVVVRLHLVIIEFVNRLLNSDRLLDSVLEIDHFSTFILWPVIVLFILYEIVEE